MDNTDRPVGDVKPVDCRHRELQGRSMDQRPYHQIPTSPLFIQPQDVPPQPGLIEVEFPSLQPATWNVYRGIEEMDRNSNNTREGIQAHLRKEGCKVTTTRAVSPTDKSAIASSRKKCSDPQLGQSPSVILPMMSFKGSLDSGHPERSPSSHLSTGF